MGLTIVHDQSPTLHRENWKWSLTTWISRIEVVQADTSTFAKLRKFFTNSLSLHIFTLSFGCLRLDTDYTQWDNALLYGALLHLLPSKSNVWAARSSQIHTIQKSKGNLNFYGTIWNKSNLNNVPSERLYSTFWRQTTSTTDNIKQSKPTANPR